jgi:ASC-1-like (ASCH) protein
MIEMGISAEILQQILDGRKTIEGRLRTGKFITILTGDKISLREDVWERDRIIRSVPNVATVTVTATQHFESFEAMLAALPLENVLPDMPDTSTALARYRHFYSPAQEAEQGVVAISFVLIK